MEPTGYVRALNTVSAITPMVENQYWDDMTEGISWGALVYCNSPCQIKYEGHLGFRCLKEIFFGWYGLGFSGKGVNFLQSDLPRRTWAWDEIDSFKIFNLAGMQSHIVTNKFSACFAFGDHSVNEHIYTHWVLMSSMARYISGLTPPSIEQPISMSAMQSLGFCELMGHNGFHYDRDDLLKEIALRLEAGNHAWNGWIDDSDDEIRNVLPD